MTHSIRSSLVTSAGAICCLLTTTYVSRFARTECNLREERSFWVPSFEGTAHHSGEVVASGAYGVCSCCLCSQEAERDEQWCSACSLYFSPLWWDPSQQNSPTFIRGGGVSSHLNLI